jgi:hypothetical protein
MMRYLVWFNSRTFWWFDDLRGVADFKVKHGFPLGASLFECKPGLWSSVEREIRKINDQKEDVRG